MKTGLLLAAAAACILAASCEEQGPEYPGEPIPLTKAEEGINASANNFGFEVFHELYEEGQVLFSPLSASLALSMTATGSDGNTAKQMTKVLGFDGFTTDEVNGYYKKMVSALLTADPKTVFEIANSIWISDRITVKKPFIDDCEKYYSSEVFPGADFGSMDTIDKVNKWCSDKTHGKIKSILEEPNPLLVMALMNALYFKGTWKYPFPNLFKEKFNTISGKAVDMDYMHTQAELLYSEYDGFRMVDLPYGNGAFSMKVILPGEKEDFGKAANRFDSKTLDKLNGKAATKTVSVIMPKFTFDYTGDLSEVLVALGMADAFSPAKADFSKMSDDGLFISFVKQKTFIDVNEKGTEAAAVTIVGMEKNSAGPEPEVIIFTADRPFLFVIQENSTGAVLFIGQKVS